MGNELGTELMGGAFRIHGGSDEHADTSIVGGVARPLVHDSLNHWQHVSSEGVELVELGSEPAPMGPKLGSREKITD